MKRGARSTQVIFIHSDRYWMSISCMFELHTLRSELGKSKDKSFKTSVIAIELPQSRISESRRRNDYIAYWDKFLKEKKSVPTRMEDVGWNPKAAVVHAQSVILEYSTYLSDFNHLNLNWSAGQVEVMEQIRQRLQLPSREETTGP